ncbi:hypothetical protein [Streptomyces sp. MZ04]|uniref:hypothetical protein n=1 Tax=Streptomyces sp. MZ04 TaxID=2559236 RepID=UPI00107EC6BD|nr:hypothetical protein [Streptomyces sp. MZ04]TGA95163.1 hypothetical protein E2651_34855 [Streptomyces sp. MZ04]
MPRQLTEANVLDVWENGLAGPPAARSLLFASMAAPSGRNVADLPLSALNSLLLELRRGAFGDALPCTADCPECGESLDVTVAAGELLPPGGGAAVAATATVNSYGRTVTYRALTGRDVRSVDPAMPRARQTLLRRCVLRVDPPADDLPDEVLEDVARRLADVDPGADAVVSLNCPQCEHSWDAALDLAEHLWTDVSGYARRLLHEVHALARAYGWTEADVLAISPTRRSFYLEASTG